MIEKKFEELGISLPMAPKPLAAYVPAVQTNSLVFTAGQLPTQDGQLKKKGLVGKEVSLDEAVELAKIALLNALAAVKGQIGSLDKIKRIVRLSGYVASAQGFTDQHKVLSGASELLVQIFGEAGKHSRIAIGVASLPLDAPVEVDLILELARD